MSGHILIADDEPGIRFILRTHLRRRSWDVDEATTGTEALECLRKHRYDAVVLDQQMPGRTGVEIAREVGCAVPTFVFSAYLDAELQTEIHGLGCTSVDKSDLDRLLEYLDAANPDPAL